jgi:Flp pilus assembly protein TadG
MTSQTRLQVCCRRFRADASGAALVEFGVLLPVLLLLFAVIIEGSRTFWSYQAAISGVRDAARYLARVAPRDICASGGSVAGHAAALEAIVRQASDGTDFFPASITINSVVPSFTCVAGAYRGGPAPVATVTASMTITYPFSGVFEFAGGTLGTVDTVVTDKSRIYGE